MLELSSHTSPVPPATSNIYRIVDKTEPFVRRFELELIPVFPPKMSNELDNVLICIRNLDRIRLDVDRSITMLLNSMLQVNHEQRTTFGNDVVFVSIISERIIEMSARQSIDDVDNDFESVRQIIRRCNIVHLFSVNQELK